MRPARRNPPGFGSLPARRATTERSPTLSDIRAAYVYKAPMEVGLAPETRRSGAPGAVAANGEFRRLGHGQFATRSGRKAIRFGEQDASAQA